MCIDSRNWDEEAYRDSIVKERELQTRTVFRAIWAPSRDPNPDAIVVASSDGFIASYSISSCTSRLPPGFVSSRTQNLLTVKPDCVVQGHDGPVYDVKFYGDDEDTLLLSCGDDGRIRGWKWKDVTTLEAPNVSLGNHIQPVIDLINPQHKGPWGALSPIPENNALAVDTERGSIYAAAGDSCAYCWDVETGKAKMVFSGHMDFLHCIVLCSSASQIITGSEDGTARIWDCRSARCVRVIAPEKDLKSERFSSCVRCIALDASENWLIMKIYSMGKDIYTSAIFCFNHAVTLKCIPPPPHPKVCGSGPGLSLWNLPASECVSSISTSAPALDVIFDDNQILEVGAEPLVSRFDMKGTVLSQIHCAPQLSFSISLHHSGISVVGGYGGIVDVISPFGSHLCAFQCQ